MGLFSFLSGNSAKNIKEFQERGAIILDVRTVKEFTSGHIEGAINIPLSEVSSKISEIQQWNKPVIAHCAVGGRSAKAVSILNQHGVEAINGGGYKSLEKKL